MVPHRIMMSPLIQVGSIIRLYILSLAFLLVSMGSLSSLNAQENALVSSPSVQTLSIDFVELANEDVISGIISLKIESNSDSPLSQVSFYRLNELLGVVFDAPYEFVWDTTKEVDGPYSLSANAVDENFQAAIAKLNVKVDNSVPTVELLNPEDNAKIVGIINIQATASDRYGIDSVKILIDGKSHVEFNSAPYLYRWDSATISNDDHIIQARAFDVAGNSATSLSVRIRTSNFNQAPIMDALDGVTLSENDFLEFTVKAYDPDGERDRITYSAENIPKWSTFDPESGEFKGKPGNAEASLKKPRRVYPLVRFKACDPEPLCDMEEITITVLDRNRPPEFQIPGDSQILENQLFTFSLNPSDPDDDAVSCVAKRLPDWSKFDKESCSFSGTPPYKLVNLVTKTRRYSDVIFRVCDEQKLCVGKSMKIVVHNSNRLPVWVPMTEQSVYEGRLLTFNVLARDPDKDKVSSVAMNLPLGVKYEELGLGIGRLLWRPSSDQQGRYEVTFVATDTKDLQSSTVVIVVKEAILSIAGNVVDSDGKPVAKVKISASAAASTVAEEETNESGHYTIELQPDSYVIRPKFERAMLALKVKGSAFVTFIPPSRRIHLMEGEDQRNIDFVMKIELQ